MKTCTKCHEEKALSEFRKRTRVGGGFQSWCKTCANTAVRLYAQSAHGKTVIKECRKKYRRSAQGKAVIEAYIQSAQGKAAAKKGQKKYSKSVRGKAAIKKYARSTQGKMVTKVYREKYRKTSEGQLKIKARSAVACALKTRRLTKGPCAVCGTRNHVEAHHPDYTKPLAVEWYCQTHHREADALTHKEENHGTKN